MCPLCLTTAALVAAGTGSATGLAALLLRRPAAGPRRPRSTDKE